MSIGYIRVFAYLRLLRITQIPKILGATTTYAQILIKLFPFQRQIIYNIQQIFSLAVFLYLSLHLTACINIMHGTEEDGFIPLDDSGAPLEQTAFEIYIDQLYFMTTTMTTVGYGDFRAAQTYYIGYEKIWNMLLISCIQFMAIFTFTLIKERLFSLQFDVNLQQVLSKTEKEAQMFIYQVDCTMRNIYENQKVQGLDVKRLKRIRFNEDKWNDFINTVEMQ